MNGRKKSRSSLPLSTSAKTGGASTNGPSQSAGGASASSHNRKGGGRAAVRRGAGKHRGTGGGSPAVHSKNGNHDESQDNDQDQETESESLDQVSSLTTATTTPPTAKSAAQRSSREPAPVDMEWTRKDGDPEGPLVLSPRSERRATPAGRSAKVTSTPSTPANTNNTTSTGAANGHHEDQVETPETGSVSDANVGKATRRERRGKSVSQVGGLGSPSPSNPKPAQTALLPPNSSPLESPVSSVDNNVKSPRRRRAASRDSREGRKSTTPPQPTNASARPEAIDTGDGALTASPDALPRKTQATDDSQRSYSVADAGLMQSNLSVGSLDGAAVALAMISPRSRRGTSPRSKSIVPPRMGGSAISRRERHSEESDRVVSQRSVVGSDIVGQAREDRTLTAAVPSTPQSQSDQVLSMHSSSATRTTGGSRVSPTSNNDAGGGGGSPVVDNSSNDAARNDTNTSYYNAAGRSSDRREQSTRPMPRRRRGAQSREIRSAKEDAEDHVDRGVVGGSGSGKGGNDTAQSFKIGDDVTNDNDDNSDDNSTSSSNSSSSSSSSQTSSSDSSDSAGSTVSGSYDGTEDLQGISSGGPVSPMQPSTAIGTPVQPLPLAPSIASRIQAALHDDSIVSVSLSNRGFDRLPPGVLIAMSKSTQLAAFDAQSNRIGDSGATDIARALSRMPPVDNPEHVESPDAERVLVYLNFWFNCIGCAGAAAIARHLVGPQEEVDGCPPVHLRALNLGCNLIRKQGAMAIAEAVAKSTSLEQLDLSFNALGGAAQSLGSAIHRCVSLRSLSLAHTKLGDAGALFLSSGLAMSPSLVHLDLSGNAIGDRGVEGISLALSSSKTLGSLTLAENVISDGGLIALGRAMRTTSGNCLAYLDLKGNRVTDEGATELAAVLGRIHASGSSRSGKGGSVRRRNHCILASLNLGRNRIRGQGAEALFRALALPASAPIFDLALFDNPIGSDCGEALAALVGKESHVFMADDCNTPPLTHLSLFGCLLGDQGSVQLADGLRRNTVLIDLDLRYNDIGPTGGAAILASLKENKEMRFAGGKLHLGYNRRIPGLIRGQIAGMLGERRQMKLRRNERDAKPTPRRPSEPTSRSGSRRAGGGAGSRRSSPGSGSGVKAASPFQLKLNEQQLSPGMTDLLLQSSNQSASHEVSSPLSPRLAGQLPYSLGMPDLEDTQKLGGQLMGFVPGSNFLKTRSGDGTGGARLSFGGSERRRSSGGGLIDDDGGGGVDASGDNTGNSGTLVNLASLALSPRSKSARRPSSAGKGLGQVAAPGSPTPTLAPPIPAVSQTPGMPLRRKPGVTWICDICGLRDANVTKTIEGVATTICSVCLAGLPKKK